MGPDRVRHGFLLSLGQCRRHLFKGGEVLVDIRHGVGDGDGPLLVPPVGLRHHATVQHAEPVELPQIRIDRMPLAVVMNFVAIEQHGAVRPGALDVSFEAGLLHDLLIARDQGVAHLADVGVALRA